MSADLATCAPDLNLELPRLCASGTVVCLASGPSLTPDDVAYVRGKATVIAVNDTVRLAPWAEVLYSSDPRWWDREQYAPDFAGLRVRVCSTRWYPSDRSVYPRLDQGVVLLKRTGDEGLELSRDGLRTTMNSGGAAINLAVHLGATRVILIGYDMGAHGGREHFFDLAPGPIKQQNFESFRSLIATMATPLSEAGIAVLNCSRRTALTCFPRPALETVL